jgi:hypothetical protein
MFLQQWGEPASKFGWNVEDLFMRPGGNKSGLAYWLEAEIVDALGPQHAITEGGRIYDRVIRQTWTRASGLACATG